MCAALKRGVFLPVMKNLLLPYLFATLATLAATLPVPYLERFDAPLEKMLPHTAIAEGMGLEKGALEVTGAKESNQIGFLVPFDVTPGEQYAFQLVYKTTKNVTSNTFIAQAVFYNDKGTKQVAPTTYFKYAGSPSRFTHRLGVFTVPENCGHVKLMLRFAGMATDAKVWVDNLRIGKVGPNGEPKAILLDNFDTTFDSWDLNHHLVFERFCMGNGGKIVQEWKQAKIGEAFFQCNGSLEPMQYSLMIENLVLKPQRNYILEGYYKATDDFVFNGHGILIFFQKDINGKAIGQTRFHIRETKGEWKPFTHTFTTLPDCYAVDIGLNTRRMKPEEYVCLDHLRFYEGKGDIRLETSVTPAETKLDYRCTFVGIPPETVQKATLIIADNEGKSIVEKDVLATPDGTIDLKPIPDAYYTIQCKALDKDGKELSSAKKTLAVCKNPTWSNDLGIIRPEDQPPIPWAPLAGTADGKVKTWNDTFAFNNTLLIESLPGVLASPMAFTLNGAPLTATTAPKWQCAPSSCSATQPLNGDGWTGTIQSSVDYSGFTRFTFNLTATRDLELSQAQLDFQLAAMDFLHRSDESWTAVGAIDLHETPQWSAKHFYNEVTFGTLERGLVWYAPKVYPAVENHDTEWLHVDGSDNSVHIQFENAPRTLKQGESTVYEFAVAPYPFRPVSDKWRTLRFRGGDYSNLDLVWQTNSVFKYFGSLPDTDKPAELHKILADDKIQWLIYQFPFYIMDTIPEWSYFEKEWRALPARAYNFKGGPHGGMASKGDIRQRTWQDYYLRQFKKHLSTFKWAGVYYDCFGTDVLQENGESFHPTFETRHFQERIYAVQRQVNPATITITHLGAGQFNTAAAFSDAVLMGEQYRGQFSKHDYYTQFMSLDRFRYENVPQTGPARMLLPQYRRKEQIEGVPTTMHFLGMAILHNLMIYPNFIKQDLQLAIRGKLYEYGLQDATFYPYWKPGCPVSSSNTATKASCYENPKGLFVTVMNPTPDEQPFTLHTQAPFAHYTLLDADGTHATTSDAIHTLPPYQPLFFILTR